MALKTRAAVSASGVILLVLLAAQFAGAIGCAPSQEPGGEQVKEAGIPSTRLDPQALAEQVRGEFLHAWNGYKQYAWGHDDLKPLSRTGHDWHEHTLYMTPVDALDTMIIMGLDDEARSTREFIARNLTFDLDIDVKVFEITIRMLGGLLSTYELTGDDRVLAQAEDLGNRLLPAFDTPTGMPFMYVNLKTGVASGTRSNPAEIGTLILEFGTLSRLTGRPVFFDRAKKALVALYDRRSPADLVGEEIDVESGAWLTPSSHVGARIDSYYEYLLKCERLFGDSECGTMWRTSIQAANLYLDTRDQQGGLWYGVADMDTGRPTASTFGALHAFLPGVLALSGEVERGRQLQESAFKMWKLHGLEPELLDFSTMTVIEPGYQLRPELAESAYYLHTLTGDERYLEMGQTILNELIAYCRVDTGGYTIVEDVTTKKQGDYQHSFFLAETLKYLYLLFAPDAIDFKDVVFNTEAHPLKVP